ncbi:MAG: DUF433 domain-containing protein [Dehalococcoidia bacterium]
MAQAPSIDIGTLIVSTPGVVGGSPRIAGSRISVKHIAQCFNDGLSPAEMIEQFPSIDLAGVYAAITYYIANREAVDLDIEDENREVEQFIREFPEGHGPRTIRH